MVVSGLEADSLLPDPAFDDFLDALERSSADEEDVRRIEGDEFLVRVFPAAARRDVCDGAFEDLQKRQLDALAGYIAGDRRIVGLRPSLSSSSM